MIYFDFNYIIMILPCMLLAWWAQHSIKSNYKKYSQIRNLQGLSGAEVARRILDASNVRDVSIRHISGTLTDHYDPRNKTLSLSDGVYDSCSVAAAGIAAHEVGHAIQHNKAYFPLALRNNIVPVVNLSSGLAGPLIIIGFVLSVMFNMTNLGFLIDLGILFFAVSVAFHLITLPVEFNASFRAMKTLRKYHILYEEELKGVRKVLTSAAMTYVASALAAVMQLLYYLMLSNRRR